MSGQPTKLYAFGPYRLNVGERILTRGSEPVALPPKVFDTLVVLITNSGHLVDKETMMREIWPDAFVEEANLSVNISVLRKALGDAPEGRAYIETVAKRGYRFVAEVHELRPDGGGSRPPLAVGEESKEGFAPFQSAAPGTTHAPPEAGQGLRPPAIRRLRLRTAILLLAILASAAGASYWALAPRSVSLAVLPFETFDRDSFVQILCDSTTKRIIDDLSLSGNARLRVKARSAVLGYAGKQPNAVEAGRTLGVDFVLSGNVRRQTGAFFNVQVELLRVSDGVQIFGKEYNDTNQLDFPALSRTVVHETAAHLPIRFSPQELKRMAPPASKSPEAVRLADRADALFWKASPEALYRTISLYQQAIDLDPTYAHPYGRIADAYAVLGQVGALRPRDANEKAREWAVKALRIDDTDFGARLILLDQGGPTRGDQPAPETIERNYPGFAFEDLAATGQLEKLENLTANSPGEPLAPLWHGRALYYQRRFDAAIAHFRKMLEDQNSDVWYVHDCLAWALLHAGRTAEAGQEFERVKSMYPNAGRTGLVLVAAREGRRQEASRLLAELRDRPGQEYVPHVWLGWGSAALGDRDEAFRQMQMACTEGERFLRPAQVDPPFDPLRADPRFQNLLRCPPPPGN